MAIWKVSSNVLDNPDFSTIASAVNDSSVMNGDIIYIYRGQSGYNENISLPVKELTLIGIGERVKMDGGGTLSNAFLFVSNDAKYNFVNFHISNYGKLIRQLAEENTWSLSFCKLENGELQVNRQRKGSLYFTEMNNVNITQWEENDRFAYFSSFRNAIRCKFVNVTNLRLASSEGTPAPAFEAKQQAGSYIENCYFEDTEVQFYCDDDITRGGIRVYPERNKGNLYKDCSFRYVGDLDYTGLGGFPSFVACATIQEAQAKCDADMSTASLPTFILQDFSYNFTEIAQLFDANGFLTTEDSYVKNHACGVSNFASTTTIGGGTRTGTDAQLFTLQFNELQYGRNLLRSVLNFSNYNPTRDEVVSHVALKTTADGVNVRKTIPIRVGGLQEIGGTNYFEQVEILQDDTLARLSSSETDWTTARNSPTASLSFFTDKAQWKSFLDVGLYTIERGVFSIPTGLSVQAGSIIKLIGLNSSTCYNAVLVQLNRTVAGTTSSADFGNVVFTAFSEETSYNEYTNTLEIRINKDCADYINGGGVDFAILSADDFNNVVPTSGDTIGDSDWFAYYFLATSTSVLIKTTSSDAILDGTSVVGFNNKQGQLTPVQDLAFRRPTIGSGIVWGGDDEIPTRETLNESYNELTIAGWVYPVTAITEALKYPTILTSWDSVASSRLVGLSIEINPGTARLACYFADGTIARGLSFDISGIYESSIRNNWVHLASTFKNGDIKLFLNGEEVLSGTSSVNPVLVVGAVKIGKRFDGQWNPSGTITDTIILDTVAYSESEIKNLSLNRSLFDYETFKKYEFDKGLEAEVIVTGTQTGLQIDSLTSEYKTYEDQLPQDSVRELVEQKSIDSRGWFINTETYNVDAEGSKTWEDVKTNVAIIKTYGDVEETNIKAFNLNNEIYETFTPEPVEVTGVSAIVAGSEGLQREIKEIPCSKFDVKQIKFKNAEGVEDYLFFWAKDENRATTSDATYVQFEDGYKNVNGDTQDTIKLYNDEFDNDNIPMLEDLRKNQNIWLADSWQISSFTLEFQDISSGLNSNERLIKSELTQSQFEVLRDRFSVNDRISLQSNTDAVSLDMFGQVNQISDGNGYFINLYFRAFTGNDDLSQLDAWLVLGRVLNITAFDAWELCTFVDSTIIKSGQDKQLIEVTLRTQPKTNYEI